MMTQRLSIWMKKRMKTLIAMRQKLAYLYGSILMMLAMLPGTPLVAFADGSVGNTTMGQDMIKAIVVVVCNIVMIMGILFIIIGLVKLVTAHANEDGPAQQKAATFLATGVVLVVLPMILKGLKFPEKLGEAFTNYDGLPTK